MSTHASALTTPRKVVPDLPACEFACNGPRRHEGPQGATPRTRSASTTPVWTAGLSCMDEPTQPRTSVPAVQPPRVALPSSSNPNGASQRWCRRPAPPSTLGFLYPDAMRLLVPHQHPSTPPAPAHRRGTTAVDSPSGPVNSGSSQVGVHDTTHPARGPSPREPKRAPKRPKGAPGAPQASPTEP